MGTHLLYMFVEIVSHDFSQLELMQSAALNCSSRNGDVIGLIFSAGVYTIAFFLRPVYFCICLQWEWHLFHTLL